MGLGAGDGSGPQAPRSQPQAPSSQFQVPSPKLQVSSDPTPSSRPSNIRVFVDNVPMLFVSVLILAIAIAVIGIYNSLVRLRVLTQNAWSDIGVQLKRRHDLIPNLVNTVQGYASHERETLQAVTDARTKALMAHGPAEAAQVEGQLTQALKSLFAVAESYPELRASTNFSDLQSSLNEIEAAIQNARRYYNAVVRDLNTKISQFPSNIVASVFKFEPQEFFELERGEEVVPEVKFSS